jgi:hypothetical protein
MTDMQNAVPRLAIKAVGNLLALMSPPPPAAKRLAQLDELQTKVRVVEDDLAAKLAAFAAHETATRADIERKRAATAQRREDTEAQEGQLEAERIRIETAENDWSGLGMPGDAPLRNYEDDES